MVDPTDMSPSVCTAMPFPKQKKFHTRALFNNRNDYRQELVGETRQTTIPETIPRDKQLHTQTNMQKGKIAC